MRHRSTELRLRRTFADVLATVLATGGAVAVTGCGVSDDAGPPPGGPVPELTSLCEGPARAKSLLAGLRASPPLDGAVERTETAFLLAGGSGYEPGGVSDPTVDDRGDAWTGEDGESVGTLCASASDPSACRETVAGYRILPTTREACVAEHGGGWETACKTSYILYTRGDEIGVARTPEEIKALIGTIDTVEEAVWAAKQAGFEAVCRWPVGAPDPQYRSTVDGGWNLALNEGPNCATTTYRVVVHVDDAGNVTEVGRRDLGIDPGCAVAGRKPEGLRLSSRIADEASAVGAYFASMATLEAASVTAFRRLGQQLASFGAPRELLARVREAVRDEIRHARATAKIARKYGVEPSAPVIDPPTEAPTLLSVALENAREGCVRETFGALLAHVQRVRAGDAEIRACMDAIADEETEHAALSWDVGAWLESQLGASERAAIAAERRAAFTALARELASPVAPEVTATSGIPAPREALALLEGLAPMMLAA